MVLSSLIGVQLFLPIAQAAPEFQLTSFPTPTPGPDGRIIYIVQPNDTLWRISAITGVSLDVLRSLNNLAPDEAIVPGQEILLGLAGPSEPSPTAGPPPSATPILPTPTPLPGTGTLCVLIYNDRNGDATRQEEEPSIPGGAISVTDRSGKVSQTATTTAGNEPHCFQELPQGDYSVSVAVPDGFNSTTVMHYALVLDPGSETFLDFGAQANSEMLAQAPTPEGSGTSPLLGILGGLLLLSGIGLAIYASRMSRKTKPQSKD